MQFRCRRQRVKSSSDQGNSKASRSMVATSGMSRRIIHLTWMPSPLGSNAVTNDSPDLVRYPCRGGRIGPAGCEP
jgi:hypothetical protein